MAPRVPTVRRAGGAEALRLIFATLPDGYRHLWLGDSGMGKSVASQATVDAAVAAGMIVIAHDDSKSEPQIRGPIRVNPAEIKPGGSRPLTEDEDRAGVVVFRGDPYAGVVCEVEEVAAFALELARQRVRVCLYIDELDRAVSEGGRAIASPSFRLCLTQGRAMGLCVLAGTQNPARAPEACIDQATSIGFFRCGPRALNYLDQRLWLDAELLELIPNLQVGEFVLHRPGERWDRTVYKFPPPRR